MTEHRATRRRRSRCAGVLLARGVAGTLLACCATVAGAHAGEVHGRVPPWSDAWWMWIALALATTLHVRGVAGLWTRAGIGVGVKRAPAAAGLAGFVALAIALLSPLDALGSELFWAHMLQHEALMLVAAPLLVVGRAHATIAWGLPARWRGPVVTAIVGRTGLAWLSRQLARPLAAWAFHALALWLWHVPRLFEAALASTWVHDLQHASFFASALAFWASVARASQSRTRAGIAVLSIFTTMVHMSLLGALLVAADRPLYPTYAARAPAWGYTGLADQQLGGLIMWVPGGIVYLAVAVALFAGWLHRLDRSDREAGT